METLSFVSRLMKGTELSSFWGNGLKLTSIFFGPATNDFGKCCAVHDLRVKKVMGVKSV